MNDHIAVIEETAALLASLRGVFDGEEPVDELDHALQSATNALVDGADDGLVLASALHDIARSPLIAAGPAPHDVVARQWLTPRFGQRIGWLAGAHVAAKRYLIATEPDYAAMLSGESSASLTAQGGPALESSWTSHRWWPDAVRLRRFDDRAKVVGASAASIDDVLAVAHRVLTGPGVE